MVALFRLESPVSVLKLAEQNYLKPLIMKYKVHKFNIHMEDDQLKLEDFLNKLQGEIVAIIPNNKKVTLAQIYGISRKVNFLLIVEKVW